jgi:hypothetical protein
MEGAAPASSRRAIFKKACTLGSRGVIVRSMKKSSEKIERSVTIRVPDNIYRQLRSRVGPGNVLNTIRDAILSALEAGVVISPPHTHHLKVELTANEIKRIDQAVGKTKFTSRNRWIVAILREALQEDDVFMESDPVEDPEG